MFDGLGTELNSIIDNLCSKFGTTVDALIPELCKYKVYESIGYLTAFSMIAGFILIVMLVVYIAGKKSESFSTDCCMAEAGLALLLFFVVCCMAYQIYYLIIWKNAPTGAAVNYVIQQLKSR